VLRSTATVATTRAERYRDQLASHGAGMLRQLHQRDHAGPPIQAATVDDETVVLTLAWGRCTITATDEALVVVAEAATPENLARLQSGVGNRVTKIGRRDDLTVTWSPTEGEPADGGAPASALVAHRGALTKISMVLLVGVVLAVHLGIGAALLRQRWAWWTIVAIAVVVALKLVVARHLFAALDGHRSQRR
jgi:hypothetical protein